MSRSGVSRPVIIYSVQRCSKARKNNFRVVKASDAGMSRQLPTGCNDTLICFLRRICCSDVGRLKNSCPVVGSEVLQVDALQGAAGHMVVVTE